MLAKAGDVYCVYNNYLKKYTACQITKIEENDKNPKAVILSLDWSGEEPLKEAELSSLQPLYKDFMYWNRGIHLSNVDVNVPTNYTFVGNVTPLTDESTNSYATWGNGYEVYRQLKWQEIPKEQRDAFKEADKSEEKVIFAGEECGISKRRLNDEWKPFEDAMELKVFPCLTHLTLNKWHKNLYEYLQSTPFISELVLENHNQTKLDFSKTSVCTLSIDMTDVEELILNDGLEQLILLGEIRKDCNIQANGNEQTLLLQCDKVIPKLKGLQALGKLHVIKIEELDIEEVLNAYPKLTELRLWGKPGNLLHFDTLSEFKELEVLTTMDLFGFTAEDIPRPDSLPNLRRFWMNSLPEDAAKVAKKLYKKRKGEGLDLWVTKPRKPEWLAQNLDNPFRSWDGQENITPANAKKAAALYRKTRAGMVKLVESSPDEMMQGATELVKLYTEGFNKMDKGKYFIETVEREDIYTALDDILDLIPAEFNIDKENLLNFFDELKDF
ncbi:gliding motility protein [Streptococcus halitosis]|uniref:gliding motility protein n=2 Tax=Streptococcus TaxID=1301 RepID=UPI0020063265|nr:gliding motility protein [Streptococcus halitosis]MCK6128983.1 gliding motility protein [Streptococcus halitosis]MCK6215986.1 gliding motility protein [Streptococcus halitosis]